MTCQNSIMKFEDFIPGTWFAIRYGFKLRSFYVEKASLGLIYAGNPNWCSDSIEIFSLEDLVDRDVKIIGHSKRKWYWKFLPWKIIVVPFYKPD